MMHNMGFDQDVCKQVLAEKRGNVHDALEFLLQ